MSLPALAGAIEEFPLRAAVVMRLPTMDRQRTLRALRNVHSRSVKSRPLLLLLTLLLFSGCGAQHRPRTRASAVAAPADTAVLLPIDAAGLLARVSGAGARATLVNVWATWCPPCREEFPAMVAVARRHRAEGLRLLLVSGDFGDH